MDDKLTEKFEMIANIAIMEASNVRCSEEDKIEGMRLIAHEFLNLADYMETDWSFSGPKVCPTVTLVHVGDSIEPVKHVLADPDRKCFVLPNEGDKPNFSEDDGC